MSKPINHLICDLIKPLYYNIESQIGNQFGVGTLRIYIKRNIQWKIEGRINSTDYFQRINYNTNE